MRAPARVAGIAAGLFACLILDLLWRIARRPSPWPRRFLRWAGRCAGLRVRVVGRPLPAPVLIAANHESWLDILAVGGATGAVFVSRADVADWPLIGWLARRYGTLFVAREDRRGALVQAQAVRTALAGPVPVALFPEGTTAAGPRVLPFRPSLFAALFPPARGLSVQPIAIDYGPLAEETAWAGDEPFGANAARILARPGTIPVTLSFLPPIAPTAECGRKAIAAAAERAVVDALAASEGRADRLYAGQ